MLKSARLACLGILLACILGLWGLGQSWPPSTLYEATVCPEGPPKCDFSSIQMALESVGYGGKVKVLPGEYVENLVIEHNITLIGDIESRPHLRPKDPEKATIKVSPRDKALDSDIIVEGFLIDGHSKGIEVEPVVNFQNIFIRKNIIVHAEDGIVINGSSVIIEDNNIIDCKTGIYVNSSIETIIKGNSIRARDRGAAIAIAYSNVKIVDNNIQGSGSLTGIGIKNFVNIFDSTAEKYVTRFFNYAIIQGNFIRGAAIVAGGDELQILNNVITHSSGVGISSMAQKGVFNGNVIMNIKEPKPLDWFDLIFEIGIGYGMIIVGFGTGTLELKENFVLDTESSGIVLGFVGAGRLRLESNVILGSGGYGIAIMQGPDCFIPEEGFHQIVEEEFLAEVIGANNTIAESKAGDLCPTDYPWPEGFKKP